MDIMTPSYLFSAISMLLMGYNTRYLAILKIIRNTFEKRNGKLEKYDNVILFRKRLKYIKKLQLFSIYSLISSVFSIFLILLDLKFQEETFALSLIFFMISLCYSILEILLSTKQF